jgi:tetratricopeptide (TPR) repeat protein
MAIESRTPVPALAAAAREAIRAGRHADAVALLEAAGVERGGDPASLRLLAEALRPIDPARSRTCWNRVLASAPGDPEAHFFLGELDRAAGDIEGAIGQFRQALARAPDHPAPLNNLGLTLEHAGRYAEAETVFRRLVEIVPGDVAAMANLAQNLYRQRRFDAALPWFDRVVAKAPHAPAEIWANRGVALKHTGALAAAEASLERATRLDPSRAAAWGDLGLARLEQNRLDPSIDAYRRALALDPSLPNARWNLAMAGLAHGDRGAWEDHEVRLTMPALASRLAPPDCPRYAGGDVRGKTVIVDTEQGYGDLIQFVRFSTALAERGAKVIVRAPLPIAALLRTVPGVDEVVTSSVAPRGDAWIPVMSLPLAFGAHPHGDGTAGAYVRADPTRVEAVRARVANRPARLRVGLSWTGNPDMPNNLRRSCPLAAFAPLLERSDVAWFSLQRGDGEDQIGTVPAARALTLLDERNDFDGKAALIATLDLVISVCTSTAHLAGALGWPTWILLSTPCDWRWGTSGSTTGWYATARLFRQPAPGDWTSVVAEVGAALDAAGRP